MKPRRLLVALSAEFLPEPIAARIIDAECDRLEKAWRSTTLNVPVKSLLPDKAGAIIRTPGMMFRQQLRAAHSAARANAEAQMQAYQNSVRDLVGNGWRS